MERDSVQAYVEEAQATLNKSPRMDEANTKFAIVSDFIELLGWEVPSNTELEYSVSAFGNNYRVDYAFIAEEAPVAFIEAKRAGRSLTNDHNEQMSSYMKNENVDYGVLTNAKEYRFFDRSISNSGVRVNITAEVELGELSNKLGLLKKYEGSELLDGEENTHREGKPPYKCEDAIVFIKGGQIVESFKMKKSQSEVMKEAINFLIRNRNPIDNMSIPYVPGRKNAVINDSSEHPDGREMNVYKELVNGYYLNTGASRKDKEKIIQQIAEECGIDVDFNW